jgi:hypothetical protein
MGFWKERRETDLERELRAQRPQPRAELLQLLCRESATQRSRRSLVPRIALVGAVTVVLVASLGAAGAVGYATKSVEAFSHSVLHIVQSPSKSSSGALFSSLKGGKKDGSQSGNKGGSGKGGSGKGGDGKGVGSGGGSGNGNGNGNGGGNGNDRGGGDGDNRGHDPFHHEYDHRVPICHDGQVVYVPSKEYFYRLDRGDKPIPCPPRHRH